MTSHLEKTFGKGDSQSTREKDVAPTRTNLMVIKHYDGDAVTDDRQGPTVGKTLLLLLAAPQRGSKNFWGQHFDEMLQNDVTSRNEARILKASLAYCNTSLL